MSLQDPISNVLCAINNAQMRLKSSMKVPYSKFSYEILNVLLEEGYIGALEVHGEGVQKSIFIKLKYYKNKPVVASIKRISKSSRRVYVGAKDIQPVLDGYGISVLSTPKGVMSNKMATHLGVGGEVVCEVY